MTESAVRPRGRTAPPAHQNAVVVGYDEGPAGAAALRWAAAEAELRGARLRVVHQLVGQEVPDRYGPAHSAEAMIHLGTWRVTAGVRDVVGEVPHLEVFVTTEPIADELLRESVNAELLVVGSSYARMSSAVLFDAVSRFLIHHARCPVVLVPAGHTSASVAEVVCGVDRSEGSSAALRWATHEAALRGVMVLAEEVQPGATAHRVETQSRLSDWVSAQRVKEATTILCRVMTRGRPADALVDSSEQRHAMLVVGAHDAEIRVPHRCVTGHVAAQDRVPVVVVPNELPTPRAALRPS